MAVAAVVAGMDRELTYAKAKVATRLILGGAEFVATNTDGTYPEPDGLSPGTGWVIGALQGATDVTPTVIGKPRRTRISPSGRQPTAIMAMTFT